LVAKAGDGTPKAVFFGYACHPVCRGHDTVYDSDYCGYAAELIESQLSAPALFFQGAAGDLDPTGTLGPALVAQHGTTLGNAVVALARGTSLQPVTGPLRNFYAEPALPLAVDLSNTTQRASTRAAYQTRVNTLPTTNTAEGAAHRHAQIMVNTLDTAAMWSVPMPIQCWQFGGLKILAMAHEVTSGYAVGLRSSFPTTPLWVMAFANETEIYVTSDELLWAGGYEAGWNNGAPTIAGIGGCLIPYTWPSPLKSSPRTPPPPPTGAPGTAPRITWDTCVQLLNG
jgi:neutral ceramidase